MLHCEVVCVLEILTFWGEFALMHYAATEDGGILLQLPSNLCKTLSILGCKSALVC